MAGIESRSTTDSAASGSTRFSPFALDHGSARILESGRRTSVTVCPLCSCSSRATTLVGFEDHAITDIPSNHLSGIYDRKFARSFALPETESYVQTKRSLGCAVGTGIDLFLEDDPEHTLSFCSTQLIRKLCHSSRLAELERNCTGDLGTSGGSRRAWLDDRSCFSEGGRVHREYLNPLSARALYRHLQKPRFDNPAEPNADRRLIYIENLDGSYIYALAETAVQHQVPALREAIVSHLSYDTNFNRAVSPRTKVFRISMHVTFPVTVLSTSEDSNPQNLPWRDTSFANKQRSNMDEAHVSGMYTARKTIEICGRAYQDYTVWAFFDALHGTDPVEEKDENEFSYDKQGIHEDPITAGESMDANKPSLDVRCYAVHLLNILAKDCLTRWKDAIGLYKEPFMAHKKQIGDIPTQSRGPGRKQHHNVQDAHEQNQKWREMFSEQHTELSRLIGNLVDFLVPEEDTEFLFSASSMKIDNISLRVHEIKQSVKGLKDLDMTLTGWLESCNRFSEKLDLALKFEAETRSVDTTNTTMWTVQFVTPIMVTIGICSMNENFIPFTLNKVSLMIAAVAVFVIFYGLQRTVAMCDNNPEWWRKGLGNLKNRILGCYKELRNSIREIGGMRPQPDSD